MFECFLGILFLVYCIVWIVYKLRGNSSSGIRRRSSSSGSGETYPNGFTHSQYRKVGFTDDDVKIWGLDQNAAPDPHSARMFILGSLDDYQGEKKDQSDHSKDDMSIFR